MILKIILDTNVRLDMFIKSRSRHTEAQKLVKWIEAHSDRIILLEPMHLLFEFALAVRNEKSQIVQAGAQIEFEMLWTVPVQYIPIPIDLDFFHKYYDKSLPYLRAGDYILIALAKKEEGILISEDAEVIKKARQVGIEAYRPLEFLAKYEQALAYEDRSVACFK